MSFFRPDHATRSRVLDPHIKVGQRVLPAWPSDREWSEHFANRVAANEVRRELAKPDSAFHRRQA